MRFPEFENILTPVRMNRYLNACNGQTKKAMALYRLNLALSREFLPVIGCFEVALKNAIDKQCTSSVGIFPARPCSSPSIQLNHTYVFKQLRQINKLRNWITHHEPICFEIFESAKSTAYARATYGITCELFHWMSINKSSFLYGLDHIIDICDKIDTL